jgi:poly-gamma-glutamate synthesis protein (capsule biosynthesis protein)
MRKKILTALGIFLFTFLAGLALLQLPWPAEIQGNLISPPKTYFATSRHIATAFLSQKDTKVPELNRRNLDHAAITLLSNLKDDQGYDQVLVILDPSLPADAPDSFVEQVKHDFPNAAYRVIRPAAADKETTIYNQITALKTTQTLLILQSYLNYTDIDPELTALQKLHYKDAFDNLSKSALDTLPFSNPEAVKAVYQLAKESESLKALPTLEDSTHEYQIKYLAEGFPTPTENVNLTFFGDIMLGRHVRFLMDNYGQDYPFENMDRAYLQTNDLLIANLEGPVAEKAIKTTKSIAFRFLPDVVPLVKKYYFDAVSEANNHALDMGAQGLADSYKLLSEGGLTAFGHPRDLSDQSVAFYTVNGRKIALLGLNNTDFKIDKAAVITRITELRAAGYQVIPFIHWGVEYKHTPSTEQVDLAHAFVDAGSIAVVGMHPHVVESIEIYNNAPIFYSLGNAIFDQYFSQDTQEGLSFTMRLTSDELRIYLSPIKIEKSQFRLMLPEERTQFLAKLADWWRYDQETKDQILKGQIVIKLLKN